MSKRILIITGDGGESYEVLYAMHRFQEEDYTVAIAATQKRWLHLVKHDFLPGWETYAEHEGYRAKADVTFDEVDVDDYEAVMLIGGRAPEYLRNNNRVLDIVREFDAKGKWIFSICHGMQIYVTTGLAEGRRLTCYTHVRSEVEAAGGTWDPRGSMRDGNVVSAQTWMDHPGFYKEIFACLESPQKQPATAG